MLDKRGSNVFYGVKGHCYVTKIRAIVASVRLGSTLSKWKWHTSGVHIGTSECVLLDHWFCSSHGHCPRTANLLLNWRILRLAILNLILALDPNMHRKISINMIIYWARCTRQWHHNVENNWRLHSGISPA